MPEYGTVVASEYQKLDPNHLKLERLIGGIFAAVVSLGVVIGLAITALASNSLGLGFAIAASLSVFAIVFLVWAGWIYPGFAYRHASWRLSPHGLEIRRGVWWRHRIVVPRSRVQHSDIEQGPMQRGFGIATLVMHTAGTKNSSVRLEGLTAKTAESLRDILVSELTSRQREPVALPAKPEESRVASAAAGSGDDALLMPPVDHAQAEVSNEGGDEF